jgi:glycosyltransferase involved in cell wall biosynthesis
MKYRIGLFLDTEPFSGGAFQFCQSILDALSALNRERFETVVGYTNDLWIDYLDDKKNECVKIFPRIWRLIAYRRISGLLPMKWWRAVNPYFHPVTKSLVKLNCNLWIFPSQDTWSYLIPVPAIGTIYDLMHRYEKQFPEVSAYGKYGSRERHYRNMCRWSAGLLVDSEVGQHHVLESYHVDPEKIKVLPFVAPKYISGNNAAGNAKKDFQLPGKYFFYPAQFWEHKNHGRLVRAIYSLKDQHPDIMFVFVGSRKNGYQATIKLVNQLDVNQHIKVLGYVPDAVMPELYRGARAMIMPTFFGPTNIPPLEAMTLGCPVAISDIYGMRQQLGNAALYFNPNSVKEITTVMKRLWQDDSLCIELSKKGIAHVSAWNQRHFNTRLEDILTETMAFLISNKQNINQD